jgi:putative ABC transport system ATP-binding protein
MRLQDVSRTYQMGEVAVPVLRHVTFDIQRGEFLAIVGPSGSGKTTILNLVGGLDSPSEGRIWYEDRELTGASPAQLTQYRRHEVGFVFQFFNLVPNLTARENVMLSSELSRESQDVDQVLERVGLTERKHHFPSQMSGGEQQRVAIARAVSKNPALLLCDEPTGSLDFETGKKVLRVLVDLNRQWRNTIVVITHNSALAQVADRVMHLRSGQVTSLEVNPDPLPPEEVQW